MFFAKPVKRDKFDDLEYLPVTVVDSKTGKVKKGRTKELNKGVRLHKQSSKKGDNKMMGGGSLKMDKMKMAGGGMMEDMKAAGMKMADGGKMPMDAKTGKPVFAVDGKGKMGHGGMAYGKKDKMGHGGMAYGKKKMMHGGGAKAFKRKGSGEQTVARGSGAARPQMFRKNG